MMVVFGSFLPSSTEKKKKKKKKKKKNVFKFDPLWQIFLDPRMGPDEIPHFGSQKIKRN